MRVTEKLGELQVKIESFLHETIREFLVAEGLIDTFKKGGKVLLDALRIVYHYEVNIFVRGAFECMNIQERKTILHNFEERYSVLFSSDSEVQEKVTRAIRQGVKEKIVEARAVNPSELETKIREQILYYVGRLPLPSFPEILRFAYYNEPASILRRIAAIGAMLHGDEEIERDYLSRLILGSSEDIENRSVQLVYFGDVEGDIHTFRDDNRSSWTWTKNAIYHRLKLNSQREMRLRWWDLRTLYLFYESRNGGDIVTNGEYDILVNCSTTSKEFSDTKKEALVDEKERLVKKLNLIMKK